MHSHGAVFISGTRHAVNAVRIQFIWLEETLGFVETDGPEGANGHFWRHFNHVFVYRQVGVDIGVERLLFWQTTPATRRAEEMTHRINGFFGTGPGEFSRPLGIDVDSEERIIVAERDNSRVQILQIMDPGDDFLINPGLNDAWFNPATNGQGFLITVFVDRKEVFLAWFTYDIDRPPEDVTAMLGEPGHRWLTAQGTYEGDTANLTIFVTEGGVFDASEPVAETDPAGDGTMTVEFADCTEGFVKYEITSLGISGEIPIERITPDNVALCEALASP